MATEVPAHAFPLGDCSSHGFGLPRERRDLLATRRMWVTGAGTGFGRAVSIALGLLGASVVLTGRREHKLRETIDAAVAAGAAGDRFEALPFDLTDAAAYPQATATLVRLRIHGVIHCAAVAQQSQQPPPLLDTESLPLLLRSNVEAAWRAARAAVQAAIGGDVVRVVLFSSEAGWHFTAGFGPYNVSKAALNNLGGSLAAEVAARYPSCDVQINVLNPGEARSEMNQGSLRSPCTSLPMILALVSHQAGGPNGRFFHADGRHLGFAAAEPWPVPLYSPVESAL
jgi:NAD(P)-dependent dehydrogenase (short-subunit alcohol dehydrogenase family)